MTRRPAMRDVFCPDCTAAGPGQLHALPADLRYQLIRKRDLQRGDRIHACDRCEACGKVWYVKVLRSAA